MQKAIDNAICDDDDRVDADMMHAAMHCRTLACFSDSSRFQWLLMHAKWHYASQVGMQSWGFVWKTRLCFKDCTNQVKIRLVVRDS